MTDKPTLEQLTDKVRAHDAAAIDTSLKLGRDLLKCKADLPIEQFNAIVRDAWLTPRDARELMRLAGKPELSRAERDKVRNLMLRTMMRRFNIQDTAGEEE